MNVRNLKIDSPFWEILGYKYLMTHLDIHI